MYSLESMRITEELCSAIREIEFAERETRSYLSGRRANESLLLAIRRLKILESSYRTWVSVYDGGEGGDVSTPSLSKMPPRQKKSRVNADSESV